MSVSEIDRLEAQLLSDAELERLRRAMEAEKAIWPGGAKAYRSAHAGGPDAAGAARCAYYAALYTKNRYNRLLTEQMLS